ncbi:MAG: DNA-3-methyladenine glycosylase family protein [Alphaproteobacteria bacterium]
MTTIQPLTDTSFAAAVEKLCADDAQLATVVEAHGAPEMRRRPVGFATLMLLILEQQVSLASARATFERLSDAVGGDLTPSSFLALGGDRLKAAGLSRQKARYGRVLAQTLADGGLELDALDLLDDRAARAALMQITGIGAWTADVYLMTALGRADIWPAGDLALAVAAQKVLGLEARPNMDRLTRLGEKWRPWRAVAARILWHYYLSNVRQKGAE